MGAHLRLPVAQHTYPFRLELVARSADVLDLVTDVMYSTIAIAIEKPGNRRSLSERLEQLDLGIRQRNEDRGHAMIGLGVGLGDLRTQRSAIDLGGLGDIADGDCHMVEASDHALVSLKGRARHQRVYARLRCAR